MAETKNSNKPTVPIVAPALNWYRRWHNQDHHALIHWGLFLIIIAVLFVSLSGQIKDWVYSLNGPETTVRLPKTLAILSLDPQIKTVAVGDKLDVNIVLDTGPGQVDGVDIYSLHYDPTLLKVIDDILNQPGTQIAPGIILNLNAANIVEPKSGTIKFGQVANGGTSFHGKGVLATIHFQAVGAGNAYLKFDFNKGSTIDSNAAYRGKDQLARVVDAIYTVLEK